MHIGRRVEPEAAVMMFGDVPAKKINAVRLGVFPRAKARGKIRAILECLELRLRVPEQERVHWPTAEAALD